MGLSTFWQIRLITVLAALSLVLVLVNIVLHASNRGLQRAVAERNLYIQQGLQLERVYQPLIRGLAELAASERDDELRDLLASEGIQITVPSQESELHR